MSGHRRFDWRGNRLAALLGLVALLRAVPAQAVDGPHWSFQPVSPSPPPETNDRRWPRNAIDSFVLAALEARNLAPAPEADRATWLRRVFLDTVGLPPTPEQVRTFLADTRDDACERVVDELLASPRHGECWATHWLDVVRYADTDGFEVNTERPNAWPYRDYVIRAFNEDMPYDRFIRDQLAGDSTGEDAATGFLITAAALLPGQIGQDDASKRLARQDELGEIVINSGQSFLGLSLGCARCHDHKFDPISQRDYYSMQAFFAGVHYGERPLRSPEAEARRLEVEALKPRLAEIDDALARFEPLARIDDTPGRETHAGFNEESFAAIEARFVRFSIHDANHHPTLGRIEPCIDEFEIFTAGEEPRNVALTAAGTKVTASGSRTGESHRLEYINDGRYGNGRSWMSDEAGRGWVLFELREPARIDRIVWSRDRDGAFDDRLATAFTLEAGLALDEMRRLAHVPALRPAVNPRRTIDHFAPVVAKRLRFTIAACTSLEPCLDEIEVFTSGPEPKNIALASAGTKATASGTIPESPIHRLEHINDGLFGNAHSWMSNETGRGWIALEFDAPRSIDRIAWGRDRDGQFSDRLPTEYTIEVGDGDGQWHTVAGARDRHPVSDKAAPTPSASTDGLRSEDAAEVGRLLELKHAIEAKIAVLSKGQMIFAGTFSTPEKMHVLTRGDPEQPRDEVDPSVPRALGLLSLPPDSADVDRRLALAAWIARPDNPLTARVMVNRLWQWHFGIGLVETSSDFGHQGTSPSHPALLDWLATEFVRSGWSIRHIHRLILTSATFRQSNRIEPAAQAIDADDRLLWRFPSRRMDAEAARDSMLAVSGRLNLRSGGPGFDLFRSRGGLNGFPPVESFEGDGLRRMVFSHKVRMERDPVFGALDCPDAGQSTARRRQSTSPIQALNLLNSRFTIDEAGAFAERIRSDAGPEVDSQIRCAYQWAFSRQPDSGELSDAQPIVRNHGLSALCRALFNSNEFLFIP